MHFRSTYNIYIRYQEVVNYLIFGALTTFLTLFVYYALTFTILNPKDVVEIQVANILSWIVGFIFAYVTNRKYVFHSNNEQKFREFISFFKSRLFTLLLDMLIIFIFVTLLHYNLSLIHI